MTPCRQGEKPGPQASLSPALSSHGGLGLALPHFVQLPLEVLVARQGTHILTALWDSAQAELQWVKGFLPASRPYGKPSHSSSLSEYSETFLWGQELGAGRHPGATQ